MYYIPIRHSSGGEKSMELDIGGRIGDIVMYSIGTILVAVFMSPLKNALDTLPFPIALGTPMQIIIVVGWLLTGLKMFIPKA